MKTKIIALLIVAGAFTLSFSVVSVKQSQSKNEHQNTSLKPQNEPIGGFVSADKL